MKVTVARLSIVCASLVVMSLVWAGVSHAKINTENMRDVLDTTLDAENYSCIGSRNWWKKVGREELGVKYDERIDAARKQCSTVKLEVSENCSQV